MCSSGPSKRRYSRNQLPTDRVTSRSRLNQSHTPGDLSEAENDCPQVSTSSRAPATDAVTSLRYWTKAELGSRAKLSAEWKEMINGPCHRKAFLTYLGEGKLPLTSIRTPQEQSQCCSRCNPMLFPPFTHVPETAKPITRPRTGTRAGFAVTFIDERMAIQVMSFASLALPSAPAQACTKSRKDQLRRPKVLTISCSLSSIESCSVVLLLYWWGRWQGVGLAQGLDRGLESAGTGVARGLLGASISNVICEGRK
jgi:hypothetical protein